MSWRTKNIVKNVYFDNIMVSNNIHVHGHGHVLNVKQGICINKVESQKSSDRKQDLYDVCLTMFCCMIKNDLSEVNVQPNLMKGSEDSRKILEVHLNSQIAMAKREKRQADKNDKGKILQKMNERWNMDYYAYQPISLCRSKL